jgi:penicillin-binding protein 1A
MAPYGEASTFHDGGMLAEADTAPLPLVTGAGQRRRFRRFAYRATLTVMSLLACLAIAFGLLLLLTPSAGQAPKLAAALAREHGVPYPGPSVPANFARPLIATEDQRFYSEVGGEDPIALARVAGGAVTGAPDQGGATLELQLAKLLYVGADSPRHGTLSGKLTEIALAFKLDLTYSKPQILRLYAEVAYYGHGFYGLEAASCGYFGRPAAALTVTQGAMLAGVVNAPTADDPINHPAQAHARLTHVINRMVAVGDLTPAQGAAALGAPLGLSGQLAASGSSCSKAAPDGAARNTNLR